MSKKKRKQNKPEERPAAVATETKEDICYEYGIFGLDSVDCDILRSLETDEKRNAYLKKRFPEGI